MSFLKINNKNLKKNLKKRFGKNNQGKITLRSRGQGSKRLYRQINFQYSIPTNGLVSFIEYDPNRSAFIAKILFKRNNSYSYQYHICNQNLNVLQNFKKAALTKQEIKNQNISLLKHLSVGDFISNIERVKGSGSIFTKSAGTYSQIISKHTKYKNFIRIQLPSKEQYYIPENVTVTLGKNSNLFHKYLRKWKAGDSRHIGKRPSVRGVAKNPVDHPHGGGEGKSSIGRAPVTPEGRLTKNVPTRSKKKNKQNFFIALTRRKNSL